ncbi:MAG: histidine phosphatase family protein [Planctomycetes bacterium]|nr:histidine phosphatase family protein [Planctomycetota bacterium]MCB9869705.1 histidine phosphatase family protein [Planctomycetota bacterium]
MSDPRRLYLVRHGETAGESSIRFHGRNDVPLSDLGRRQIRRLAPLLREVRFAAVVHSPLCRAAESARILIEGLARRPDVVEVAPGLTEIDFGEMEGLTDAEIAARRPDWHAEWKAGRANGFPGGEPFAEFARRIEGAFAELLARHPHGDVLVVGHKGTIKRGVRWLVPVGHEQDEWADLALGSVSVVACGDPRLLELWSVVPPTDSG